MNLRIEERDGDYIDPDAIFVRVGNKDSGPEIADWVLRNYKGTDEDKMALRQRYIRIQRTFCPFPEIADEGPVVAELLRADPVGLDFNALEIWSVGGQHFSTYRDVRNWRCHQGDSIGEITVGGKAVPVYQVRKRLI